MIPSIEARVRRAAAWSLLTVLSGCSSVAVFRQCGFAGCPGDGEITAKVHTEFSRHAALEAPNLIDVQTLAGVVYLTGIVDTDLERQMAEEYARSVRGVERVVDSIGLSGSR